MMVSRSVLAQVELLEPLPMGIDGVAYAHWSIAITLEGLEPQSYRLDAGLYLRASAEKFCFLSTCNLGMATPFGYWYYPPRFEEYPHYHREEVEHLRQWEALGPIFPFAYLLSVGEPFGPYRVKRDILLVAANEDPANSWDMGRMWKPPEELSGAFPQLRAEWRPTGEATITLFPGYAELIDALISGTSRAEGP